LSRTTTAPRQLPRGRYSPLFWRVLALNAGVLVAACVITLVVVSPGHLSSFAAQEAAVLVGALALVAVANLVLLKGAFRPLERVTRSARRIDPNQPGQRVPVEGDTSEAGQLAEAINEMLGRLEAERQLSAGRSLQAQERERLRVAQELHDQVGQRLTGALLQLSRVVKQSPPELRDEALEAQDAVRASLEDVRRIAVELRPEALDELGLWSALAALAERISEQSGLRIERRVDGSLPDLSGEAELVIYRVAQEALTNVVRHAGADQAALLLERRPQRVVLRVVDGGRGLGSGDGDGVGLRGMRERAAMVGAELSIADRAEGGVEVMLAVPVEGGAPSSR
jgi:two-component system sensor histidine kinase UhpB